MDDDVDMHICGRPVHVARGFSRCRRTPLSNKRSTILFEKTTNLKVHYFVEKVQYFC